jgi:hypothetical protein
VQQGSVRGRTWIVLALVVGCKSESKRFEKVPEPPGSGASIEPVFQNGSQVAAPDMPQLALAIDRIYRDQQPSKTPPYHVAGGTWTYFDAHAVDAPAAKLAIGMPLLKGGSEPSFAKAMLVPTTTDAGTALVAAFAKHFAVPVPPRQPGTLSPTEVAVAVLGVDLENTGGGFSEGGGTWTATKLFLSSDDVDSAEVFFNFSLADKRAELSEKDADYDKDLARVLAVDVRDGKPAPRTPDTDPTLAAKPAQVVVGAHLGERVDVIAATPQRALIAIDGAQNRLAWLDLHDGSVADIYTTQGELGIGACDRTLARCAILEVTPKTKDEHTISDPATLKLLEGGKLTATSIPVNAYAITRMSPDGRYLVFGFQQFAAWDLRTNKPLATLDDSHADYEFAGWRGAAIVLATRPDSGPPTYQLWHVDTGKLDAIPAPANESTSPDGSRKVAIRDGRVIVTPPTGAPRSIVLHPKDAAALGTDGCCEWLDARTLVINGHRRGFLDTDTMKVSLVDDDDEDTINVIDGSGHALVVRSDGAYFATIKL